VDKKEQQVKTARVTGEVAGSPRVFGRGLDQSEICIRCGGDEEVSRTEQIWVERFGGRKQLGQCRLGGGVPRCWGPQGGAGEKR
jgi:hypothetical protein